MNQFLTDLAIIGTTDINYQGDPAQVSISESEIDYLLAAANEYFKSPLSRSEVIGHYAGVRPLYDVDTDNPSAVSRDYVFDLEARAGEAPLLSIFGGKITTYRKVAEAALAQLTDYFPAMQNIWTGSQALPGGDFDSSGFEGFLRKFRDEFPWLPESLSHDYARRYGTRARRLIGSAKNLSDLGVDFGEGLYVAEVNYLCQHEWAKTADDILFRRTKFCYLLKPAQIEQFRQWFNRHYRP